MDTKFFWVRCAVAVHQEANKNRRQMALTIKWVELVISKGGGGGRWMVARGLEKKNARNNSVGKKMDGYEFRE